MDPSDNPGTPQAEKEAAADRIAKPDAGSEADRPPPPEDPHDALDELLNATEQSFVLIDRSGRIRVANRAADRVAQTLFGRPLTPGAPFHRFVNRSNVADFETHFRRALAGERVEVEKPLPPPMADHWFRFVYSPVRRNGEITGVCFNMNDITRRRQSEAALRASEDRFRRLFQSVPAGVAVQEPDGRFAHVNPSACEILGHPAERLLKSALADLDLRVTDPEGNEMRPVEYPARRTFRTGAPIRNAVRGLRTGRGECRWLLVNTEPARNEDGKIFEVIVTFVDITPLKAAERKLAETSGWFRSVFEGSRDAVFISDPDGRLAAVNPAASELTGYSADALARMTLADLNEDLDPACPRSEMPEWREGASVRAEAALRRADGETVEAELAHRRIRVGGRDYLHTSARDLTERRRAEQERGHLESQLLHAHKLKALGQLAAGIAHDFNNVISPILGYGEVLQTELPPDSAHQKDLEQIVRAAHRSRDLVRRLLAFSRKQVLELRTVDLARVISELSDMLARTLREHIGLRFSLEPEAGCVRADPGQMEQVLMNLTLNAQDAMPQGGKLTFGLRRRWVSPVEAAMEPELRPGPYLELAVRDTGEGMSAETRARLFEPFYSTKPRGRGTGMGLAMVWGIIQQHRGHIRVSSERGRGTTFSILLPRVPCEEAEEPAAAAARDETVRGEGTIAVAEDDAILRDFVVKVLEREGYRVISAGSGTECLERLAEYDGPVKLLLTDVIMPGMDGAALLSRLRQRRPELRVLFMSGYPEDVVNRQGGVAEKTRFLKKPFSMAGLTEMVREALGKKGD